MPPKCTRTAAKNDSRCGGFVTVPQLRPNNRTGGSPTLLKASAEVDLFPKYDENLFHV